MWLPIVVLVLIVLVCLALDRIAKMEQEELAQARRELDAALAEARRERDRLGQ